jgi:hypothetical protein
LPRSPDDPSRRRRPHPLERRQELFRALVEAQDGGLDVPASLKYVAERFAVTEAEVRWVEREGLDGQWPPLGDGP